MTLWLSQVLGFSGRRAFGSPRQRVTLRFLGAPNGLEDPHGKVVATIEQDYKLGEAGRLEEGLELFRHWSPEGRNERQIVRTTSSSQLC